MTQPLITKLKYLRMTPRKTRLLVDTIRGLPVGEAEAQLILSPRRASEPLLKLLHSAVANAKNNHNLETSKLFIKEIRVDQGITTKRWMPRARGAVSPIHKRTSHVTLILETSDNLSSPRFSIQEKLDKKSLQKDKPASAPSPKLRATAGKEKKEEQKPSFTKPTSRQDKTMADKKEDKSREAKSVSKPGVFQKIFRRKSI